MARNQIFIIIKVSAKEVDYNIQSKNCINKEIKVVPKLDYVFYKWKFDWKDQYHINLRLALPKKKNGFKWGIIYQYESKKVVPVSF